MVLLCILATTSQSLLLLLGPCHSFKGHFLYHAHPCMKYSLDIFYFLEEISSLSHSIVFLSFFALITEVGFLISPCYSLEFCIQMGISFLLSFVFHFSSFLSYLYLHDPDNHNGVITHLQPDILECEASLQTKWR